MNRIDPHQLISAYLDGTLTNEQALALNQWVKTDKKNARQFVESSFLHRRLLDRISAEETTQRMKIQEIVDRSQGDDGDPDLGKLIAGVAGLSGDESGTYDSTHLLEAVEEDIRARAKRMEEKLEQEMREQQLAEERRENWRRLSKVTSTGPAARHYVIPKPLFYGGIAALIAIAAAILWPSEQEQPSPVDPSQIAQEEPSANVSTPAPVATLRNQVDAQWLGDSFPMLRERIIPNEYALEYGLAEFVFDHGAQVIIHGPARFSIDSRGGMTMHKGRMVGLCETIESQGFIVQTPFALVEDLGTEFGVDVDPAAKSEVHVFDGEVAVSLDDGLGIRERKVLYENAAARVNAGSKTIDSIDSSESQFIREVISPYELAIRSARPVIHFRFDEPRGRSFIKSSGGHRLYGHVEGNVTFGRRSPLNHDRDDRAVFLNGDTGRIVIDRRDYDRIDFTKSFSIEAWIRPLRKQLGSRGRIISNRPEDTADRPAGFGFGVHEDGGLMFSMFGRMDIWTDIAMKVEQWHHVVAVIDEDGSIFLFINGEPCSTQFGKDHRPATYPAPQTESDASLIIGVNPNDIPEPFIGELDELAIYNRELTKEEIFRHAMIGVESE